MTVDNPPDLLLGGCSAWSLPLDETCAGVGRRLLRRTLSMTGMPGELIQDIALATSELITNGLHHGIGGGRRLDGLIRPAPPHLELWAYHRLTPDSRLVVKVFDPNPYWNQPAPESRETDLYAEHGRGTDIIEALTWQWGHHRTRSRLAIPSISGKATWFCVPVTGPCHQPRHSYLPVPQAAQALYAELATRGIDRMQCRHGTDRSLVAIPGLTIWAEPPGTFRWQHPARPPGTYLHRPIADLIDVAEEAVHLHEQTIADQRTKPVRDGSLSR